MKLAITTSAAALLLASAATAQTAGQMPMGQSGYPATGQTTTQPMGDPAMGQMNTANPTGTTMQPMNQTGAANPSMGATQPMDQTRTDTASDMNTGSGMNSGTTTDGPTSPDGSPAFGIEPYFGILGGYNLYDQTTNFATGQSRRFDGALVGGVVGVNIPLGPLFVGVEGHGARGFGDIRWEYGVRGRGGFRAGDSGLFFASVGYTWTDARGGRGFADRKDWVYGIGAEFGPRDIGLGGVTSRSGPRFRIGVETADFDNIRPMAGVIFHF